METTKRFVILEHTREGQETHWDLMLEVEGRLETYRLGIEPSQLLPKASEAIRIFDHSLKFLDYEGPVNNGLGAVRIVDKGSYEITSEDEKRKQLRLKGQLLKGGFLLVHVEDDKWEFGSAS